MVTRVHSSPKRMPLRTRSYCFAPMFWETKVVTAIEKAVTGRKAKPSTFVDAPMPAMARLPKELM